MTERMLIAQYYLFMEWFKTNHLLLFSKYQLHIKFPTGRQMIEAEMEQVNPEDWQALQDAISQYYATEAG